MAQGSWIYLQTVCFFVSLTALILAFKYTDESTEFMYQKIHFTSYLYMKNRILINSLKLACMMSSFFFVYYLSPKIEFSFNYEFEAFQPLCYLVLLFLIDRFGKIHSLTIILIVHITISFSIFINTESHL